ncbi:MAG: RDD family protein [Acidimicrobiaceae bacterium]|nr:RDD family protein [Acidimicrobiaceae bacterium]MXW75801.1 RDD family protein [Acidimicrobiaceae bacterium]MYA74513.1 RDD family protein [Acidimicrobiaceae bacterium]MYC43119.1 RDD family protein [Acidimicrobiaceae bacterium]MYD08131.1 RDD family protein [Acidimicrobiaceae bacterium]
MTNIGENVELAGAGHRLLARVVDAIVVLVPAIIAGAVGGEIAFRATAIVFGVVYEVSMIANKGQTVGKMATRIKVIKTEASVPPGWDSSLYRWALPGVFSIVSNLSSVLGILGLVSLLIYLSLLWGKNRQGWHDMVAKTFVVKA